MYRIRAGKATHILKEDLKNTTSLLVDETGDTLHTTTTRETTDGGLSDTCKECVSTITMCARNIDKSPCYAMQRAFFGHRRMRLTLNVITKNLAMTLGSALAEALAAFAA